MVKPSDHLPPRGRDLLGSLTPDAREALLMLRQRVNDHGLVAFKWLNIAFGSGRTNYAPKLADALTELAGAGCIEPLPEAADLGSLFLQVTDRGRFG